MLAIEDLTKDFIVNNQKHRVFEKINLAVTENQLVSILGPSGCGKSTLLKMIAGLETYDSGKITNSSPHSSFVFQEPRLLPWLNVIENILLPAKIKKIASKPEILQSVQKWLEFLNIEKFKNSYPHELSGGMKMRVSIARSLIENPSLLFMDEPFSSLDEKSRSQLQIKLLQLNLEHRMTCLFVTHSISEACLISDRIIILNLKGEIIFNEDHPVPNSRKTSFYNTSEAYFQFLRRITEICSNF